MCLYSTTTILLLADCVPSMCVEHPGDPGLVHGEKEKEKGGVLLQNFLWRSFTLRKITIWPKKGERWDVPRPHYSTVSFLFIVLVTVSRSYCLEMNTSLWSVLYRDAT